MSGSSGGASRSTASSGASRGGAAVREAVVAAAVAAAAVVAEPDYELVSMVLPIETKASPMKINHLWSILSRVVLDAAVAVPLSAAAAPPQTFATPEAAVDALAAALKADSDAKLLAIFGDEHKDVIVDPDRAAASANRARIVAAMQTLRVLKEPSPDRRVLVIGDQAWPFPIPLVKTGDRWHFATEQGVEELINRRIGGNERNAIYVLRAYVDAQREFASRDRDGDGVLQYAQKLASSLGKHDGLYWPADAAKDEEQSPVRTADRRGRALPQGPRARRSVSRLLLPDPDATGRERGRRRLQLRDQRPDDRRLRFARVPRRIRCKAA